MAKKVIHTSDGDKLRDTRTGKLTGSVSKKPIAPKPSKAPKAANQVSETIKSKREENPESAKQMDATFKEYDWINPVLKSDWTVRETFAERLENPESNLFLFERLSKDEFYEVREAVVCNPNTPSSVIMAMWDPEEYSEIFFAENPNTPDRILSEILDLEDLAPMALYSILKNPNASQETLEKAGSLAEKLTPENLVNKALAPGTQEFNDAVRIGKAIAKENDRLLHEAGRQRFPDATPEELEHTLEVEAMNNFGDFIMGKMKGPGGKGE